MQSSVAGLVKWASENCPRFSPGHFLSQKDTPEIWVQTAETVLNSKALVHFLNHPNSLALAFFLEMKKNRGFRVLDVPLIILTHYLKFLLRPRVMHAGLLLRVGVQYEFNNSPWKHSIELGNQQSYYLITEFSSLVNLNIVS